MSAQVTRRQHHVWRYYLESWTTKGRLYCRDGVRIFQLNPRNASVETDFYKLNDLTDGDLALLEAMIERADPGVRPILDNFIQMFSPAHRMQRVLAAIDPSRAHAVAKFMAEDSVQAEENYHASIEGAAKKSLDFLREGEVEVFPEGKELVHFCYFLGVQYFRTKGMKERVLARVASMEPSEFLTPNSWNIQSHFYATHLGASIFRARSLCPVRVIKNLTSTPFITTDQPVVNLHGRGDGAEPTHMAIYYPISPWRAVFIDDANLPLSLHANPLTEGQIVDLNTRMARSSFRQVYGLTELSLHPLSSA